MKHMFNDDLGPGETVDKDIRSTTIPPDARSTLHRIDDLLRKLREGVWNYPLLHDARS